MATQKIDLITILAEALCQELVDIFTVITWQVNGTTSDQIILELRAKIDQARLAALDTRKQELAFDAFLTEALRYGNIDQATAVRWRIEGVSDDIRAIKERQISRARAQA